MQKHECANLRTNTVDHWQMFVHLQFQTCLPYTVITPASRYILN